MNPRRRFAARLFLAFAALVALSTAASVAVLERLTTRRSEADFRERFERARLAFDQLQRLRARFVSDEVEMLARANPQLRTVLATASFAPSLGLGLANEARPAELLADANLRLRSLLPSVPLAERSEPFAVLGAGGELLFSRAAPERAGDDLSGLALYQETVAGGAAAAVWTAGAAGLETLLPRRPSPAVYHVLARAVLFDDAVQGVVIAGAPVDAALLAGLRDASGLDLALVAGGAVVASTLAPERERALAGRLAARPLAADGVQWSLAGAPHRLRAAPIDAAAGPAGASFVLLLSREQELAALASLRASLLLAGAAIALVALGTAFALASGITRPVAALARAARRIGAGELDTEVAVERADEFGELGAAFNEMARGLRERDRIRRTFERYVSREVAEEVLRHPELVPAGGARRELTAMFVDLGGFSAFAERHAPETVMARLGEYFEAVCACVIAHDGTVNEFLGDGVVAFWGAPVPQPDHAARACAAALDLRDRLEALLARWGDAHFAASAFRIGLHTGTLVVGEVGSAERRAYRAVGDAMNLASRIEGACRHYGVRVLVSQETRDAAGPDVAAREVDTVRVVGRAQPVTLFEPVRLGASDAAALAELHARYAEALAAYRRGDFADAERGFAACLALAPGDGPSARLCERTRRLAAAPPPDWRGVSQLEAK